MKKLLITLITLVLFFTAQSQELTVKYGELYTCEAEVFFAVRVVQNNEVSYRLTTFKVASPGSSVTFDLESEMSDTYIPASEFADPTRPMFGGVKTGITVYYDAGMEIGEIDLTLNHLCASDSGKIYKTRDGEFHYTIVDDLNGLIR